MNQKQSTLVNRLDGLNFEIERSIQYCDYRLFFWQVLSKTAQLLEAVTSSAAFFLLFRKGTISAHIFIAITAFISILAVILGASQKANDNMKKMMAFNKLSIKIPDNYDEVTEEQYKNWRNERKEIDNDGSTHIPCLSVICHNDICLREGINDIHPLTSFEKNVGKYLPFPYRSRRESKDIG